MNVLQANPIRQLAWVYAAMFVFTVALGYIPPFTNEAGELFGLFRIELKDDLLHLGSGIWAALAGWYSLNASVFYFKTFGVMYGLDGLLGLITGHGYLDGGIFLARESVMSDFMASLVNQPPVLMASIIQAHASTGGHSLFNKIAANMPHILIGGGAIYIGFVLSRKFINDA
ncbi:MAG: hypothetical protein AAF485_14155 [Chloroflexota bacterium]